MFLLPSSKVSLGCFPTPVQPVTLSEVTDRGIEFWLKRDDLSSFDLSGNKVRKLEFLLADAIEKKCDSVITIGGLQSNHARATAVAARQLGLQPFLILRTSLASTESTELGIVGNLLLDRIVDAKIFTVSAGTYARIGSNALCKQLEEKLIAEGHRPYVIPVGGSNTLGAMGYMECVREVLEFSCAQQQPPFDHIVTACGSGGTLAGLAIGLKLSGSKALLHAVSVCDSPQYFYNHLEEVANALGLDRAIYGPITSWCSIYDGQGIGYARSTDEELSYLIQFASGTGVTMDPVYSGKALFYFMKRLLPSDIFKPGQRVLFIHTGGTLGLYDKANQLLPLLPQGQVEKLVARLG
jgi:D-cysteine desulfhydrase family pyridoxal phosphate-dependent enzyme